MRPLRSPGQSRLVEVAYGQGLRLVDVKGGAAPQLIVVVAGDSRDRISAPNSIVLNRSVYFTVGGVLAAAGAWPVR